MLTQKVGGGSLLLFLCKWEKGGYFLQNDKVINKKDDRLTVTL